MVLTGAKVSLRPITIEDTDMVLRWRNSDAVKRYFIFREDITYEAHLNWLRTKVDTGQVVQFIITEMETERSIGSVYLQSIDSVHKNAEYGIFIGEQDALGKGHGTEAAQLILQYGFDVLGLHKVYLRVLSDNERAIASYLHAGFEIEGLLKDEIFVDGRFCDITRMALIGGKDSK